MKKIFSILTLVLLSIGAYAQHTSPRFGTAGSQDNTYSRLTLGSVALADTAGATPDTLTIIPGTTTRGPIFTNHYTLTLTDSCVIAISNIKSSYKFDRILIDIENTTGAGHWVKFLGYSGLVTKWHVGSSGTKLSPATGESSQISFFFNGTVWVEECRQVQ